MYIKEELLINKSNNFTIILIILIIFVLSIFVLLKEISSKWLAIGILINLILTKNLNVRITQSYITTKLIFNLYWIFL